jgi:hypothetical protein
VPPVGQWTKGPAHSFAAICLAAPLRLDVATRPGHVPLARRLDGRCRREAMEESPGSTGIRCRLTAGGGDPRESATENKPPVQSRHFGADVGRARVKRGGKSAPRLRQRRRQGKPHQEQDRIGAAASALRSWTRGHSRPAARVGRVRRVVRRVPEEWSSRAKMARTEPGLQAVWHLKLRSRQTLVTALAAIVLPPRGVLLDRSAQRGHGSSAGGRILPDAISRLSRAQSIHLTAR